MEQQDKYVFVANSNDYACPIKYVNNRIWWFCCPQITKKLKEDETFDIKQLNDTVISNIRKDDFSEGLCYGSREGYINAEGKPLFPDVKELINTYKKEYSNYKIQGVDELYLLRIGTEYKITSIRDGMVIKINSEDNISKFNGILVYHLGDPYGILFNPTESTEEEIWPSILKPLKTLISKNNSAWGKDEYIIIPLYYLTTLVNEIEKSFIEFGQSKKDIQSNPISESINKERINYIETNLIPEINNTIHKPDSFISIKKLNEKETASLKADLPDWAGANQFFIQQEIIDKFTKMIDEKNLIIIRGPAGIGKSWFINYWKNYIYEGDYKKYVIDSKEILNEIRSGKINSEMNCNDLISIWLLHILKEIGDNSAELANVESVKERLDKVNDREDWTYLLSFMQIVYNITTKKGRNDQASILVIIHLDDLQKYLKDNLADSLFDDITNSIEIIRKRRWNNDNIKLILTTRKFPFWAERRDLDFKLSTFSKEQVIRLVYSIFKSSNSHSIGTIIYEWTGGSSIFLNMFFHELPENNNELSTNKIDEIANRAILWKNEKFRLFKEIRIMLGKSDRFKLFDKIYDMLDKGETCNVSILQNEGIISNVSEKLDLTESFLFQEDDDENLTFANKIVKELYSPKIMKTYLYGIESK